jgi:preprotein translocase subunit SecE
MEYLRRVREFFHEVLVEFRKVNWPSRPAIINSTAVVLVVAFAIALYLWAADMVLARMVGVILR